MAESTNQRGTELLSAQQAISVEATLINAKGEKRRDKVELSFAVLTTLNQIDATRKAKGLSSVEVITPDHLVRDLPKPDKDNIDFYGQKILSTTLKSVLEGRAAMNRYRVDRHDPLVNVDYSYYVVPVYNAGGKLVLIPMALDDYGRLKDQYVFPEGVHAERTIAPKGFRVKREEHSFEISSGQNSDETETVNATLESTLGKLVSKVGAEESSYAIGMCTTEGSREVNEDSVLVESIELPGGDTVILASVKDGMGGHEDGDVASKVANYAGRHYLEGLRNDQAKWSEVVSEASLLLAQMRQQEGDLRQKGAIPPRAIDFNDALGCVLARKVVEAEDQGVKRWAQRAEKQGGTTRTGVVILGNRFFASNVGDSRTQVYDVNSRLTKVTKDHSLVQRLVDTGQITPEQVLTHPQRNEIYKCLDRGSRPLNLEVEGLGGANPAIFFGDIPLGGTVVSCCDGIWEGLGDVHPGQEIGRIVGQTKTMGVGEVAKDLVVRASPKSGDNDTAIVIRRIK